MLNVAFAINDAVTPGMSTEGDGPEAPSPQHLIAPVSSSAQVHPCPAEIAVTPLVNPTTSTGDARSVDVPSPSWKPVFMPQHLTPPDVVKAQL